MENLVIMMGISTVVLVFIFLILLLMLAFRTPRSNIERDDRKTIQELNQIKEQINGEEEQW